MCVLNIRWGCKGSIQEFSTLLRGSRPPQPSQANTENQDWVEPATLTTTTKTKTVLGSGVGDETVHDSHAWALPPTSGLQPPHLVYPTLNCFSSKSSFHRNQSKFEVNDFPTWHSTYPTWPLGHLTFPREAFHLMHIPFTFFTCLFHSQSSLQQLSLALSSF